MKPIENLFKNSLKLTKMFNQQVAKSFKIPLTPYSDSGLIINSWHPEIEKLAY